MQGFQINNKIVTPNQKHLKLEPKVKLRLILILNLPMKMMIMS